MSIMSNKERIFNEQFLSIPMMAHQLLLEVIQGWIWMGLAGGIIVGDSRMGKTTAIMAIINKLLNLLFNIYVKVSLFKYKLIQKNHKSIKVKRKLTLKVKRKFLTF